MGGRALTDGLTRRHDRDEYIEKVGRILKRIKTFGFFSNSYEIEAYKTKPTFGDADIIYSTFDETPLNVENVRLIFPDSKEIKRNSSVISFEFEELQVDLIWSETRLLNYAMNYFKFNDLGNLVGKVAHGFGLKHGHAGLSLPIRDGNQGLGDVLLTANFSKALDFMGYDYDRFERGFDTLEDIFVFARSSKYFNPESYKLENVSSIGRIRDKKRTTYTSFLAYNLENPVTDHYVSNRDKSVYLEEIFKAFPDALPEYIRVTRELAAQRYLKTRFNGTIVSGYTGLLERDLGEFMQILRKSFILQSHTIPILTDEKIHDTIMEEFCKYRS